MKGSPTTWALKSWAAKLHPQVPLSTRESQKLLTIINNSFRKHLDEAHPWIENGNEERPVASPSESTSNNRSQFPTSSAALADRHLASVLTNPLLASITDAKSAVPLLTSIKEELRRTPHKDPVEQLEQYNVAPPDAIALAVMCLSHAVNFATMRGEISPVDGGPQPGMRTLRWLHRNKAHLHLDLHAASHRRFALTLVSNLVREGNEELVWVWIGSSKSSVSETSFSNMPLQDHDPNTGTGQGRQKSNLAGFLLFALVKAKLLSHPGSMNAALDTILSCDDTAKCTDKIATKFDSIQQLPALRYLVRELRVDPSIRASATKERHEKFISYYISHSAEHLTWKRFDEGSLWLYHPRNPNPLPALTATLTILEGATQQELHDLISRFGDPKKAAAKAAMFNFVVRAAELSATSGRAEEAQRLLSRAATVFPVFAEFQDAVALHQRLANRTSKKSGAQRAEEYVSELEGRISIPTFG